jgi:predicted metal-dependent hydrolase
MQIEYLIKYSNRKTLNITVERDRQVVVHAPANLSEDKIRDIVSSKKDWIIGKLMHAQKYPAVASSKEFVSGEILMYLGKNYQLSIVDAELKGIEFDKQFKISKNNQAKANDLFKSWYKKQAIEKIEPIAFEYAKNLGVQFNECKISEMKYRWGSCTPKNNIKFNWRVIKAPMFVIRYIVVHELIHLIESNHTPTFWNILSIQVPDYQKAKDWLKVNGHLLEVDF